MLTSVMTLNHWLDECLERFGLLRTLALLDSGFDTDEALLIALRPAA